MITTLFDFDINQNVTIAPQALELKPFKVLWDRDKSKNKEVAKAELAFVYHMCYYASIFQNILNIEEREKEILMVLSPKVTVDEKVKEACAFFTKRQNTISMDLLETARQGIGKLQKYINRVDLDEVNDKGALVYDANKFKSVLDNLAITSENISKLEQVVKMELEQDEGMSGSRTKSMYEDGV